MILLTLSAALVVGTFSMARASRRAAAEARTRARVQSAVHRALGEVLDSWSMELDSLPVGAGVDVTLDTTLTAEGPPLARRATVRREGLRLYTVVVEAYAFDRNHPLALRRGRLWLERADSSASLAPVTKWAFTDLY